MQAYVDWRIVVTFVMDERKGAVSRVPCYSVRRGGIRKDDSSGDNSEDACERNKPRNECAHNDGRSRARWKKGKIRRDDEASNAYLHK